MGAFGGCWPHWSGFRFFDLVMRKSHLHTFTWKLGIKLPKFVIMFVIPYPLSKTWIRFSRYMPCICPSCLSLKPKLKQTFKVWDRYHQPVLFFLPVCISESALTPMSLCLDMSKFLNTWMNTALGSNHIPVSLLSSEANLKPNKGPLPKVGENFEKPSRQKTKLRCASWRYDAAASEILFLFATDFFWRVGFWTGAIGVDGVVAEECWRLLESKFRRTW